MVTFVAPAFNEEYDPYVFIGSMLCQTNPDWHAIIYHNGPYTRLKFLVESFADSRLTYLQSPTNTGAWGCYNRIDAINNHVSTDFIIQTSVQDYWLPSAVDLITKQAQDHDLIYWNSVNHQIKYAQFLDCEPVKNRIDWGNFAIRSSIAKAVGIQHPEEFTADGMFVEDCIQSNLIRSSVKIPQILTIHN